MSKPLRQQREQLQAELDALPQPKPVPNIEDVNPEAIREHILSTWLSEDIVVARKAIDRIVDEVRLEPGKAIVAYSWKAEPGVYTVGGPHGGPAR